MAEHIDSVRPDIVHIHNTWFAMSPLAARAARSSGAGVVMTLHNYRLICANAQLFRSGEVCTLCIDGSAWNGLRYRCYRDSTVLSGVAAATVAIHRRRSTWSENVDLFLAPSQSLKDMYVMNGFDPASIRVKPHFVGNVSGRPAAPSRSHSVLYVGRLSAEKGLDTLLEAWRHHRPGDLYLDLIGDGPLRAEIEAAEVPGVRILGYLPHPEVTELMKQGRALLMPSVWFEAFGLVIAEAFAAGLPVLASDLGAQGELVRAVDARLAITPGSEARWADALALLLEARWLDGVGIAARSQYEARYSEAAGATALESAYAAVLNRRGFRLDP